MVTGLTGLVLIVVVDLLFPPPLDKARDVSRVVLDRNGAPLRAVPLSDGRWRLKADVEGIDPAFVEALLAYEDKRFYSHSGVDFAAMTRATLSLLKAGRIVSGGSTITMQTARLLEPQPRTLNAKFQQMWRAWQLERRMSKDEILELYLTLAPYGGNIEGVRAASWAYFGREPRALTPDQIALLIALPQSPEARRPDLKPKNAVRARKRVLQRLVSQKVIKADRAAEAETAIAPVRQAFPAIAWHASEEVLKSSPDATSDVQSSLDVRLQLELEALAQSVLKDKDPHVQVAMMVVDVKSRGVLASIGSGSRNRPGGWLDLTNRKRSPGSTLKPFIYGMAFDDGVAAPGTQIADLPKRFQSYRPENFDRTFRGDVTISEALQHSLNVPAVQALDAVGPKRFAATLTFAGAAPSLPAGADENAGLALALGGAGLTVREVALLYTALGNGGLAASLCWVAGEKCDTHTGRVMSAQASGDILTILQNAPSPEGRAPAKLTQNAPRIAFKTGTSYGFRDAWSAGVSGGLAVVVWVGRADGAPRSGATGRDVALPILFDVFDLASQVLDLDAGGVAPNDLSRQTPLALASFDEVEAPQILFPPDEAEIWQDNPDRDFVLSARGEGRLSWFVDGVKLPSASIEGSVWRPDGPGFYRLDVVDEMGRRARSNVRVTRQAADEY